MLHLGWFVFELRSCTDSWGGKKLDEVESRAEGVQEAFGALWYVLVGAVEVRVRDCGCVVVARRMCRAKIMGEPRRCKIGSDDAIGLFQILMIGARSILFRGRSKKLALGLAERQ